MAGNETTAAVPLCASCEEARIYPEPDIKQMVKLLRTCYGYIKQNNDVLEECHRTPTGEIEPANVKTEVMAARLLLSRIRKQVAYNEIAIAVRKVQRDLGPI